jgi:hypothetical protein
LPERVFPFLTSFAFPVFGLEAFAPVSMFPESPFALLPTGHSQVQKMLPDRRFSVPLWHVQNMDHRGFLLLQVPSVFEQIPA